MKSTVIATVAAIAAISVSAHAATGMPSERETGSQHIGGHSAPADQDAQLGSYARYLMLNGKTREQAVAEARNIDHPAMRYVARQRAGSQAIVTEAPARSNQQ